MDNNKNTFGQTPGSRIETQGARRGLYWTIAIAVVLIIALSFGLSGNRTAEQTNRTNEAAAPAYNQDSDTATGAGTATGNDTSTGSGVGTPIDRVDREASPSEDRTTNRGTSDQ